MELNLKHKEFCSKIVESKGQITKSYMHVYSNTNYFSCASSASDLLKKPKIQETILQILSQSEGANKLAVEKALSRSLQATKPILTKKGIAGYVPDNAVQASTAQFLAKGYGFGADQAQPQAQVNITIDINKLTVVIDKLQGITDKIKDIPIERTGEIIDI